MAGHINSAGKQDWNTPEWLLNAVREVFGGQIALDPCSNDSSLVNAKFNFKLPEHNGLLEPWNDLNTYINPPFGTSYIHKKTNLPLNSKEFKLLSKEDQKQYHKQPLKAFINKISHEFNNNYKNGQIIALIPAAVDTKAWQNIIFKDNAVMRANQGLAGCSICFLEGRVTFVGAKAAAPMPLAILHYGFGHDTFFEVFKQYGYII